MIRVVHKWLAYRSDVPSITAVLLAAMRKIILNICHAKDRGLEDSHLPY